MYHSQVLEAEQEVVETILPLARLGSSITLTDGRTSALLGEMTPAAAAAQLMERERYRKGLVFLEPKKEPPHPRDLDL